MWVSRLSTPFDSGGEDVALDPDPGLERADQARRLGANRNQLGHGLPMLRDHEAFLGDVVKDGQTLLLELGGGDLLHGHNLTLVT